VLDRENVIRYVEYVKEVADSPNHDAALAAAREAVAATA
jgi:tetrahydromethanopterin S-methyltransferase subunit H